jgi:hypothetical protein
MAVETITIKSGKLELISSIEDIKLNSNTYIHLGAKEGLYIDVGSVDGDNKQNKVWINSPRIEFGKSGSSKTKQLEPVVKGDQLEKILIDILNLLNLMASVPGAYVPQGQPTLINKTKNQTNSIKQKIKRIKSKITYTI